MAEYNIISFSVGANTHNFHGQQDDHNHDKQIAFSVAAKALMQRSYPGQSVRQSDFQSHQGAGKIKKPSNELVYKNKKWVQKG